MQYNKSESGAMQGHPLVDLPSGIKINRTQESGHHAVPQNTAGGELKPSQHASNLSRKPYRNYDRPVPDNFPSPSARPSTRREDTGSSTLDRKLAHDNSPAVR
jgi:hypothetical protein